MTGESKGTWEGTGIAELLGWKIVHEGGGSAEAEFFAKEEFLNPRGAVMGGYIAAMLDMIISAAVRASLDENQRPGGTLEMKVSFIGVAKPGRILSLGRIVHAGRSIAFAEGTLSSPDGSLIATGSATMRIYTEQRMRSIREAAQQEQPATGSATMRIYTEQSLDVIRTEPRKPALLAPQHDSWEACRKCGVCQR